MNFRSMLNMARARARQQRQQTKQQCKQSNTHTHTPKSAHTHTVTHTLKATHTHTHMAPTAEEIKALAKYLKLVIPFDTLTPKILSHNHTHTHKQHTHTHILPTHTLPTHKTFCVYEKFVSLTEEKSLLRVIERSPTHKWVTLCGRALQQWGGVPLKTGMCVEPLPVWMCAIGVWRVCVCVWPVCVCVCVCVWRMCVCVCVCV